MRAIHVNRFIVFSVFIAASSLAQTPLGTGFTYQGRLEQSGSPAQGTLHLRFSLWDAPGAGQPPLGGNQIGVSQLLTDIPVTDGVFTVILNAGGEFGPSALNGQARWLQIEVCADPGCAGLNILSPRQPMTAAPYSLRTLSAPWTGLTGVPEGFADNVDNIGDPVWETDGTNISYNAGKVGIGTATPISQLEIFGQNGLGITGFQPYLTLRDTKSGGLQGVIQSASGNILFYPNSFIGTTPAMTITDAGNVGVGGGASVTDRLAVSGGASIGTAVFGSGSKGPNLSHVQFGPTGDWYIRSAASAGKVILQDSGGTVGIGMDTPAGGYKLLVVNSSDGGGGISSTGDESNGVGIHGRAYYGVSGFSSTLHGAGVVGIGEDGARAGSFVGDVQVIGEVTEIKRLNRMDHPLDPANKYLSHSSVDSPDMMNIYNGNVVTDGAGYAKIVLPDYFEALNKDFRYQLTILDDSGSDQFILAKVVKEIKGNQFTIRTSQPNVKVSWQVTGVRHDAFAKAHPTEVEKVKPEKDRGKYLAPEVFGQPKEMGIGYRPEVDLSSENVSKVE